MPVAASGLAVPTATKSSTYCSAPPLAASYHVALSYYARVVDLAREHDDTPMMALGASNVLTTRRKQMEVRPDAARLPEFTNEARRLVEVADNVQDVDLQTIAHRALADLLASVRGTRDKAGRHYELALGYARRSRNRAEMATCLWALGRYLSDVRPAESRTLVDEALRMAFDSGSATSMAYAWRQQMRLAWKSLPRDRALVESLRALDAIETLRTLQDAGLERASVLGAHAAGGTTYPYVVYDSEVEREFARQLDQREDIKLFVKLPRC